VSAKDVSRTHGKRRPDMRAIDLSSIRRNTAIRPIVAGLLAFAAAYIASHGRSTPYNNYTLLADAILHGRLWIDWPGENTSDALLWNGQHYVIEAPLPGLLMIPATIFWNLQANQTYLALLLCGCAVGVTYALLQRLGIAFWPAFWLTLFFFAGTDLWWCAQLGDVWFIAHVSAVLFTMLVLFELAGPARGWVVAILAACAFESRFSMIMAMPLYFYSVGRGGLLLPDRFRLSRLRGFGIVFAVVAVLWVGYNEARWGLPTDIGYTAWYHHDSWGQREGSPFRLSYFPYEVYSFFMRPPVLVEWLQQAQWPYFKVDVNGIALTFTSPALILAFWSEAPRNVKIALWTTVVLVAGPSFFYYLNGWYQFGMRHALDFEPFLLVLMAFAVRERVPRWAQALIAYSCLVSVWGIWYWNTTYRAGD
jgi:hypothetical protein